ncbi:MAG: hypothetical protein K9L02_08455, partial [Acholeplasmataceae bacterium]|nr:hypothetical protein [Acholeplasmataceae bacterium]
DEVIAEQVIGKEEIDLKEIEEEKKIEAIKKEKKIEGYTFKNDQLQDLDGLLGNANFVDGRHLWIAGFDQEATIFSGKKNLKFLAVKDNDLYLMKIEKNVLLPYRVFDVDDVKLVDVTTKLTKSSIKINFKDDETFWIDITENKESLKAIKGIFR